MNNVQLVSELIRVVFTWPFVVTIALFVLNKPIKSIVNRLINSDSGKAKVGLLEIEMGKIADTSKEVLSNMEQLSISMAKSRLLELTITNSTFGASFTPEQQEEMHEHIIELNDIISKLDKLKN